MNKPKIGTGVTRRSFISGAVAAASASALFAQQRSYDQSASPERYPDPDVVVIEKRFAKYKVGNAGIERLHMP